MNSPLLVQNNLIIPEKWIVKKITDICLLLKDGTHGTHERVQEGIPLLSAKDISKDGKILLNNDPSLISESDYRQIHSNYTIEVDDILLTVVGTLGRTALCVTTAVFSIQRSVAVIRPDYHHVTPKYLINVLDSDWFQNQLALRSNATAQAGVYLGELANIEAALPPLNAQHKIAKILTTVDNLIEKTQALIDKHTAIKQGMMSDLFTRGIDLSGTPETNPNHGQLRPTYEQAPELYKQTELGWVPKEWDVYSFGELADYKNGYSFKAEEWCEEGYPIIRIQNLNGSLEFNYYQGVIKADWHVMPGDLLFAWSGQKGVSFGARIWSGEEGVLNQHIFKVTENSTLLSRQFLFYLFKLNVGRIEDNAHGFKDSFLHVTRSELTDVEVALPGIDEQLVIEEKVKAQDNLLELEMGKLEKYKKIKKGLMQDLLTGKVRVQ